MSNKVKKIKENAKKRELARKRMYEACLGGSAIITIAKLCDIPEKSIYENIEGTQAWLLEIEKPTSVKEMCDALIKHFDLAKEYKEFLVLVYDEDNIFSPIVTIEVNGNVLPVASDGATFGALRHLGKDSIKVEHIYEDESNNNGESANE